MDNTRLNLTVADDVPAKMAELAGGERKRGEWLTRLVRDMHAGRVDPSDGLDLEGLRLQILGLAGQLRALEGRVVQLERTVAAIVAADTA